MGETTYQQTRSVMDMADVMKKQSMADVMASECRSIQLLLSACASAADSVDSLTLEIAEWLHPDYCEAAICADHRKGPEGELQHIIATLSEVGNRLGRITNDLYRKGTCAE